MFIEASDKTMRGEYTNVNLDYVKSYNIENVHKFENKINFIDFKVEGEEYPVRFSFDNYNDALLAIDAISFLQKTSTMQVSKMKIRLMAMMITTITQDYLMKMSLMNWKRTKGEKI